VMIISPGGGGYGNPFEREIKKVFKDVENGYVSITSAREDYGVVIDPESGELDDQQTQELRGMS